MDPCSVTCCWIVVCPRYLLHLYVILCIVQNIVRACMEILETKGEYWDKEKEEN